jgi:hypothetical protein
MLNFATPLAGGPYIKTSSNPLQEVLDSLELEEPFYKRLERRETEDGVSLDSLIKMKSDVSGTKKH